MRSTLAVLLLLISSQLAGCGAQLLLGGASIVGNVLATTSFDKAVAKKQADKCYAIRKTYENKKVKKSAELDRDLQSANCPLS